MRDSSGEKFYVACIFQPIHYYPSTTNTYTLPFHVLCTHACISYSPCMHASPIPHASMHLPQAPFPGAHGRLTPHAWHAHTLHYSTVPLAPGSVHTPFAVLVVPSVHTNIPTFPLPRVHWYLHTPVLASTRAYLGCLQTLQSVLRAQLMLPHLHVQTIDSTSRR